jgi:hypothetical protein
LTSTAHLYVRETIGSGDDARAGRSARNASMQPLMLFALGRLSATPGAIRTLTRAVAEPVEYIARHLAGDWGDLDAEDTAANDRALRLGERIISAYRLVNDETIWIITEEDRSATTIILPSEY